MPRGDKFVLGLHLVDPVGIGAACVFLSVCVCSVTDEIMNNSSTMLLHPEREKGMINM